MAPVVYLASSNRVLIRDVRTSLTNLQARLEIGGSEEIARNATARGAQVVVTDSVEGAWEVLSQLPPCRIVLLATNHDPAQVRAALRSGIHEVLLIPDEVSQVAGKVQALLTNTGAVQSFDSLVVAVYSGSGGLGRTTLSVAMAKAYARLGLQTLLIDASMAVGGVEHLLGITAPTTLANLLPVMAELDAEQLGTATVQIQPNLDVLCSPADGEMVTKLAPEYLDHLLNVARRVHQAIIIDMPTQLGPLETVFLRQADQVAYLMTSSPEVIRALSQVLVAAEADGVGRNKFGLVHRLRMSAALELSGAELARQVGLRYLGALPHDRARIGRTDAPAKAKGKEKADGLDRVAHQLALRLAAISGVSMKARSREEQQKVQRSGRRPLAWLKGGLSFGGRS